MKPVGQNILVRPFKRNNVSDGGLFIPDTVNQVSNKVEVVEVGNGSEKKPMRLKKGDVGYRVKSWGEPIEIRNELHFIMTQDSIIALQ